MRENKGTNFSALEKRKYRPMYSGFCINSLRFNHQMLAILINNSFEEYGILDPQKGSTAFCSVNYVQISFSSYQ